MPYKRRYNRKRYVPRKKKFTKMDNVRKLAGTKPETAIEKIANGVGTVATIAKTVAGIVSMINTEDKFIDVPLAGALTPAGAYTQRLNDLNQGVNFNERNGNKVLDKCLSIRLRVTMDVANVTTPQTFRIVVLLDKKPQLGAMLYNLAYLPVNNTGQINKNTYGDRIVVLKDWCKTLSPGNEREAFKKIYLPLDRIHTQWTSNLAADHEAGRLVIIGYGDAPGAIGTLQLEGTSRFCYSDN